MTLTTTTRHPSVLHALAVTPLLRWTIAVHSVADDQPWRTACACGRPLWNSAVRPSGRCTGCGQRVGPPPGAVEASTAVAALGLLTSGLTGWPLAAYAWWTTGMVVLAFIDLAVLRLPHRITAITFTGFLGLLAADGSTTALIRAVTAGLVLAAFFTVVAVAARGQLGWGDPALAAPVGAALGWFGWTDLYAGTLLGLGAAAITGIVLRRTGYLTQGTPIPLGPFLIAAAALVVAVHP
jgi:leader peptidase (prepilin peptidase)/N-methyltransferase